ncbi:hypothetical protein BH20ACI1_BH20ACI1_18780 [soil metagenome]
MKNFYTVFLIILFLAFNNFAQVKKVESNAALENATIKITLLDLPGVNLEKSKWELAYELRIASQKELDGATINGSLKLDAAQKLGEFVAKNSFTKNTLSKNENREVVLTIPLDKKIQEKLADDLANLASFNAAVAQEKNTSEMSSERKIKTQYFLIYANILVYDAKLKKNIIVPFDWVLPYSHFSHLPGANFQMTFKIRENGDYERSMVLPEKLKKSITITTKQ